MSIRNARFDRDEFVFTGLRYLVLVFLIAMTTVPIILVISTSIKSPQEFFGGDPHIIPRQFTPDPWIAAIDFLGPMLWNSALIATGTAILSLIITIPGAYVFARAEFPGKKLAFYSILFALMFPYILLIIPISDIWFGLGLYNTIPGMWIAYQVFVTPFAIWILRDFFENLPPNLEEAGRVYGCSQLQAIYKIILPLSAPAIVATGFLAFLVGWNDFLFSNMLTTGTGPRPAVVSLYNVTTGSEINYWGQITAYTLVVGLPPTALYMVARRYLTESFALDAS